MPANPPTSNARLRFGNQPLESGSVLIAPHPQFAHLKILDHAVQPVEMIVVRVRQRDQVDALDSP